MEGMTVELRTRLSAADGLTSGRAVMSFQISRSTVRLVFPMRTIVPLARTKSPPKSGARNSTDS